MSLSCRQREIFSRRGTHHALCHLVPEGLSSLASTPPTTLQDVTPCCSGTKARMTLGVGSKPEESSTSSTSSASSASSERSDEEGEEEIRDCVIVGGGIAGLAAAADLEKAGCDFILLEAGDRLGGRIYTHKESRRDKGMRPLELGAQWLHGTVGNPLYEFCVEEGIFDSEEGREELAIAQENYTERGFEARRADGSLVRRQEFLKYSEAWSKAVLEAETLYAASLAEDAKHATVSTAASNGPTPPRASNTSAPIFRHDKQTSNGTPNGNGHIGKMANDGEVGAFLHRRVREILRGEMAEGAGDPDEAILGYLLRKQCTVEGCDDLDGVAFAGYGMFKELEGGDVRVPGGFSRIVDAVAAKTSKARIRLKSPVSMVQWFDGEPSTSVESNDTRTGPALAGWDSNTGDASTTRVHFPEQHYHTDNRGTCGALDDAATRELFPCVVEYSSDAKSSNAQGGHGTCTKTIRCRRVLVTVGLGVLKDGTALSFSPQLPSAKLAAIRRLGFGTTDKMFVRCTRRGRSDAEHMRTGPDPSLHVGVLRPMADSKNGSHLGDDNDLSKEKQQHETPEQQQAWTNDVYSFNADGEHVCSWLSGPSARAVEAAPGGDITKTLMSVLRTTTRDSSWQPTSYQEYNVKTSDGVSQKGDTDTPSPSRPSSVLVRSDWHSNPLFRGSYTFVATGSSPADMEELARPLSAPCPASIAVKRTNRGGGDARVPTVEGGEEAGDRGIPSSPRVLFAGEAMHPDFFSTAHGGFDSGRKGARDMMDCLWSQES